MSTPQLELLYSEQAIQSAVKTIAHQVDLWAKEVWTSSHTDVVAVPILRGGIFFCTDLVRAMKSSVEIAPARSWAYEAGLNAQQRGEVTTALEQVPAKGRHIILLDDVCDSGRTLKAMTEGLLERGAAQVRSAVLIKRIVSPEIFNPDWSCFEYSGHEWFTGYGMDDAGRWVNLPYVGIIKKSA